MTARELTAKIGKKGTARLTTHGKGFVTVEIEVTDARTAFGRIDLEVTPVAGSGRMWVSADSVQLFTTTS